MDLTAPAVSILAVIVLYRMELEESTGLSSLLAASKHLAPGSVRLKILVYDNTPGSHRTQSLPDGVEYLAANRNDGLARAYNYALKIAEAGGFDWLLTIDQDSSLPVQMMERVAILAQQLADIDNVVAIVPQLVSRDIVVSPLFVSSWRSHKIPRGFEGIPDREMVAVNSASFWKVSHLRAIGGFDVDFWLDYLDFVLHHRTFRAGKKVYVAGDITVEHRLSLRDWKSSLTPERLRNIVRAEGAFNDIYKGPLARLFLTMRLAVLYFKRKLIGESPDFLEVIGRCLLERLRKSRAQRITEWRQDAEARCC